MIRIEQSTSGRLKNEEELFGGGKPTFCSSHHISVSEIGGSTYQINNNDEEEYNITNYGHSFLTALLYQITQQPAIGITYSDTVLCSILLCTTYYMFPPRSLAIFR
jgi:hypothetical protein